MEHQTCAPHVVFRRFFQHLRIRGLRLNQWGRLADTGWGEDWVWEAQQTPRLPPSSGSFPERSGPVSLCLPLCARPSPGKWQRGLYSQLQPLYIQPRSPLNPGHFLLFFLLDVGLTIDSTVLDWHGLNLGSGVTELSLETDPTRFELFYHLILTTCTL